MKTQHSASAAPFLRNRSSASGKIPATPCSFNTATVAIVPSGPISSGSSTRIFGPSKESSAAHSTLAHSSRTPSRLIGEFSSEHAPVAILSPPPLELSSLAESPPPPTVWATTIWGLQKLATLVKPRSRRILWLLWVVLRTH